MNKLTKVMEYKLGMISLIQISTLKQLITTNKHLNLSQKPNRSKASL